MPALAPLYELTLLRSRQRVESHRLIASELSDYKLGWHGRADVDTCVHRLRSPNLALYSMAYGDEVDILPQVYHDFALVHYARRGPIEITTDDHRESLSPGEVALCSPRRSVALRWSAGCEQVILRVPLTLLRQSWASTRASTGGADLPPWVRLGDAAAQVWLAQLESLANYAAFLDPHQTGNGVEAPCAWLAHAERAMAAFLADQAGLAPEGTGTAPTARSQDGRAGWRQARLDRWHQVTERLLCEPATLATLAQHMALSPRQLSEWTQQQCGLSPMAWLRTRRLEAVRRTLQTDPARDVTSVALGHGFGHLGRFSRLYHEHFGEYPSQTRAAEGQP